VAPLARQPRIANREFQLIMARWYSCNVLQPGANGYHLWQFDGRSLSLHREQTIAPSEPLPGAVAKSWSSLWQPRLNIASLPPESVFIRVAQFPLADPRETRAMVELQLEKLSPVPVTQAAWTMHILPAPTGASTDAKPGGPAMQTIAVIIVPRDAVEELLGRLEAQGFLADRLEVPELDQLLATKINEDGAWIYPLSGSGKHALVAWWYGGAPRNVAAITLPAGGEQTAGLKDQLMQMAWGGELEGWLTKPPTWHLVADEATAREWEPPLRQTTEQPIEIIPPLPPSALAGLTAKRAAESDPQTNLLPSEFAARYRQKFVDRLWLRGLRAVLGLYSVGCVVYFIALGFLSYRCSGVERQVNALKNAYTQALQIQARHQVLKQRQELKYAALDCWEKTAELLPEGATLDSLNFSDGKNLTLSGTAPADQVENMIVFSGRLGKATKDGRPLFNPTGGDAFNSRVNPGNATVSWSFGLELKSAPASTAESKGARK
jgi:hypothetical protein